MSYIYSKHVDAKHGRSFTFPQMEAELSTEVVEKAKIQKSLNALARELLSRYKRTTTQKKIIGVEFHAITFTFVLDPRD